jgi:phosphoglycolate phosphatase
MTVEAIIFDWDGTLMDSEARILACLNAAFQEINQPIPDRHQARQIIGLGLDEALATLVPQLTIGIRKDLAERYRAHFLADHFQPSPLFPGVTDMLKQLHTEGLKLAIATGKSRRGLEIAFRQTGLEPLFHATRCADETQSKPHPQMLLELLAELNTTAATTLMVGDTSFDMDMARQIQMPAVAVSQGVHSPERLLACQPLVCLPSIQQFLAWLQQFDSLPAVNDRDSQRPVGT